jgi:hypothetical protein
MIFLLQQERTRALSLHRRRAFRGKFLLYGFGPHFAEPFFG